MDILRIKRKALELINRIKREGAFSHVVLQAEADRRDLDPKEYPILVTLVRGVLQEGGMLDGELDKYLAKGVDSLPDHVADALRLGAYQILCLDRVNKKDVVFETVELLKGGRFSGFGGLVNAVLRKIKRYPAEEGVKASRNFPHWLVRRWIHQFSEDEVEQFCAASTRPLPMYLRVNTGKVSVCELQDRLVGNGIRCSTVDWSKHSLRVEELPADKRIDQLKMYEEGLFFIQDASSTLVADLVAAMSPNLVRDLCAAPGGKACSIALQIASIGGRVVASDRTQARVQLIDELVHRLHLSNIETGIADVCSDLLPSRDGCDTVLLDAPCSGFGTVGKKVEARWNTSEEDLAEIVSRQSEFLRRASRLVPPEGILVYSTCSIDREENEGVIETFLSRYPHFYIRSVQGLIDERFCTPEGFYRAWPHRHDMTGAFAAVLVRRGT